MTGVPSCSASMTGSPNPSAKDGISRARAPPIQRGQLLVAAAIELDELAAERGGVVEQRDRRPGFPAALADDDQRRRGVAMRARPMSRQMSSSRRWFLRPSIVPSVTK